MLKAKKLKLEGYDVIPHLPARTIVNKNDLEKYIGELANESGCSKILIIGGGGNQAGEISSSIDVLKTDFLSKYNYRFVGVAGHPEGSPDISNENLDLAIKQKNDFAKNVDFKMYLATQFFFEAKSLIDWEKHLEKIGNKLDEYEYKHYMMKELGHLLPPLNFWDNPEKRLDDWQRQVINYVNNLHPAKLMYSINYPHRKNTTDIIKNSSKIRIRNRCEITGRPHGVYRKLRISRIALRQMASSGKIPGITKSSW